MFPVFVSMIARRLSLRDPQMHVIELHKKSEGYLGSYVCIDVSVGVLLTLAQLTCKTFLEFESRGMRKLGLQRCRLIEDVIENKLA